MLFFLCRYLRSKNSIRMIIAISATIAKPTPPAIAPTLGPLFTTSIIVETSMQTIKELEQVMLDKLY